MDISRRIILKAAAFGALAATAGRPPALAQAPGAAAIQANDRVFIANEDSNTISVIDPRFNAVDTTINLTSFDEDLRPPFRFVTGGVMPTHAAMINKPLYHGCIAAHGVVPSPDGRLLATSGRGSSNVYLIDTVAKKVVGNTPNPQAVPPPTLSGSPAASWWGASPTSPPSPGTARSSGWPCGARIG